MGDTEYTEKGDFRMNYGGRRGLGEVHRVEVFERFRFTYFYPCDPWRIFSSASRLLIWRAAVLQSPPTVARDGNCRGEILIVPGRAGNGPRVTVVDLADHTGQHIFLCRQDLVAASWGSRVRRIH